ncbi:MAG TPA: hypothetical protein VGP72_10510 [Planctomycetota bacterium]
MALYCKADRFGGGILVRVLLRPEYAGRNLALFVNAEYYTSFWAGQAEAQVAVTVKPGQDSVSVSIGDLGQWPQPPDDTADQAMDLEAARYDQQDADKIAIRWTNAESVSVSDPYPTGAQISSVAVSGAKRGTNCTPSRELPTRARLFYTIHERLT